MEQHVYRLQTDERADGMNHYQKWLAEIEDSPAPIPAPKKEKPIGMNITDNASRSGPFPASRLFSSQNQPEPKKERKTNG